MLLLRQQNDNWIEGVKVIASATPREQPEEEQGPAEEKEGKGKAKGRKPKAKEEPKPSKRKAEQPAAKGSGTGCLPGTQTQRCHLAGLVNTSLCRRSCAPCALTVQPAGVLQLKYSCPTPAGTCLEHSLWVRGLSGALLRCAWAPGLQAPASTASEW